jgi:uncharacterized protein (DUF58 family)
VEGFISGLHKSPYHGFSVEFAQHREYCQGDDTRHLDWKVFGRSDRFYIKEYEEETNLITYLLMDVSESMRYGSGPVTKLDYASYIAASLAYLVLNQTDAVGLSLFDRRVKRHVTPTTSLKRLKLLMHELINVVPEDKTDMGLLFTELSEKRIGRRGLVVVISDFFDDPYKILKGIRQFRFKKHEVILFHVMDHYELTFPFKDSTLFKGLEGYPEVRCDPRPIREEYLKIVEEHCAILRAGCKKYQMDYVLLDTERPLDVALTAYLAARSHTMGKKHT